MDEKESDVLSNRCALEDVVEKLKGVACVCASLAVSSEMGKSRYAGCEMALLCGAVESAISELEGALI